MTYPVVISSEKPLGDFKEVLLARATDEEIRSRRVSSGGAVTAILAYLLKEGTVDGVVVARRVKGFKAELVIAKSKEELLEAAGDKWSVIPYTTRLRDALETEEVRSVALVGLPCQAQFLWQMRAFPLLETDFVSKIKLIISLFCLGTFATEAFIDMLRFKYSMDPEYIDHIGIDKGGLRIIYRGEVRTIPLNEVIPYMQTGCLVCPDYTGVFSDLSAGISELHPGYTLLLVRSDEGMKAVKEAASNGYIEYFKAGPEVIDEVETKARGKIVRAMRYMSMLL